MQRFFFIQMFLLFSVGMSLIPCAADLRRHPENVWALHGLAESLERQGKSADALKCRSQFETAARRADVQVDR
jgi:hypothetical protein